MRGRNLKVTDLRSRMVGLAAVAFAVTCATAVAAASALNWPSSRAPEGTVAIPVLSHRSSPTGAKTLQVCMTAGERPQIYQVLSEVCWAGADHCTVFVAIPARDYVRLREFDVANPPVVSATNEVCESPIRPNAGVLGQ